jgi:tetratricopeptide (TPR) repeat protein
MLLFVSCLAHADKECLQDQFGVIVGEIPDTPPIPTVREAAREYIVGRHFAVQDQHQKAIAHFRLAIDLDPHSPAPWVGLAISLSAVGRNNSAITAWKEVLLRDGTNEDALLIVGLDAAKRGNNEKGKRALSQHWLVAEVLPVEELLRLAALLAVYKEDQHITKLLNETVDSIVDNAIHELNKGGSQAVWLGIVQQLIDLHSPAIAVQLSEKASSTVADKELGSILTILPVLEAAAGGDGSVTLRVYERIAQRHLIPLAPRWFEPVPLSEALSIAAQSMSIITNDVQGPILLYKASLKMNSMDSLTINNLAWVLLQQFGPTPEVQQLSSKALELEPHASHVLDTVGWVYVQMGEPERAIPLLTEAIQTLQEPSAEIYDHLGDAYWLAGQKENAIRAWRTASIILHSVEYRQRMLEGFANMIRSVWGIVVATPEALYDFELGDITRRLEQKLSAIKQGSEFPLELLIPKDGVK